MPSDHAAGPKETIPVRLPVPVSRRRRIAMSALIVAFFSFHLWLSWRGMLLQDDRYGWRMFHNVGFSKVEYRWITHAGKVRRHVPKKKSVVSRGQSLVLQRPGGWLITLYSAGAVHETAKNYVRYMAENKRPDWAQAFEARVLLRINNEKEPTVYVYRYPEADE